MSLDTNVWVPFFFASLLRGGCIETMTLLLVDDIANATHKSFSPHKNDLKCLAHQIILMSTEFSTSHFLHEMPICAT